MKSEIAQNLQKYLDTPELVAGWITPQAVMLRDGTLAYTSYLQTGGGGLILRGALESDKDAHHVHPESVAGLIARFDAGERFLPSPGLKSTNIGNGFDIDGAEPETDASRGPTI